MSVFTIVSAIGWETTSSIRLSLDVSNKTVSLILSYALNIRFGGVWNKVCDNKAARYNMTVVSLATMKSAG